MCLELPEIFDVAQTKYIFFELCLLIAINERFVVRVRWIEFYNLMSMINLGSNFNSANLLHCTLFADDVTHYEQSLHF